MDEDKDPKYLARGRDPGWVGSTADSEISKAGNHMMPSQGYLGFCRQFVFFCRVWFGPFGVTVLFFLEQMNANDMRTK